jgi:hypothetical protein
MCDASPRSRPRCAALPRWSRREASPAAVFATVTEEVGRLLRVEDTKLIRFEGDETATVVAGWGESDSSSPVALEPGS